MKIPSDYQYVLYNNLAIFSMCHKYNLWRTTLFWVVLHGLLCNNLDCCGGDVKSNDMLPNQTVLKIIDCFVRLLVYSFTNIYATRTLRSEKHLVQLLRLLQ